MHYHLSLLHWKDLCLDSQSETCLTRWRGLHTFLYPLRCDASALVEQGVLRKLPDIVGKMAGYGSSWVQRILPFVWMCLRSECEEATVYQLFRQGSGFCWRKNRSHAQYQYAKIQMNLLQYIFISIRSLNRVWYRKLYPPWMPVGLLAFIEYTFRRLDA